MVTRPERCPLIPVPPHGRLIDADALMARFEKEEKAADEHGRDFSFSFKSAGENCAEWWSVQQMLFDAPTIIPAEEDELQKLEQAIGDFMSGTRQRRERHERLQHS